MATLRQAVERQRERLKLPQSGVISVRSLQQNFRPVPAGSSRALLSTMFAAVSRRLPWAVILCRFKGEVPNPQLEQPIEQLYRGMFTPGTGGLVEYWRDVSLGAIDITGSTVFNWVELEITRAQAGIGAGANRSTLVDNAIKAAQNDRKDPITGFHSQIAVLAHNWAKDGAPAGADWRTPEWSPFWIDGSADGRGKVTLTPPHDGNITAHEMGHGFGMDHDVAADLVTHYGDPCCIMSQQHPFLHPGWRVNFGPALCFPHLMLKEWMYNRRVLSDDGAWASQPAGMTFLLAPTIDPGARANLGAKLTLKVGRASWDYYLEYVRPKEWNQGFPDPTLLIRRVGAAKDVEATGIFLGSIVVPAAIGVRAEFVEPTGNTKFQVERFDPEGRIVQVVAKKLS